MTSIRVRREDRRVDVEEIQQVLRPVFGRHLFFLSGRELEQTIRSAYPEVSTTQVRKHFPHEIELTLYMDPLAAGVHLGGPDDTELTVSSSTGSGVYRYLTSQGIYLESSFPIPSSPEENGENKENMVISVVDWAVKPVHRQALLSSEMLQTLKQASQILQESFGHTVVSITLYLRAKEFHVQGERIVLWFDFESSLLQQLDRYRAFLRTLPLDSIEEYIDLRLHDRVVYR